MPSQLRTGPRTVASWQEARGRSQGTWGLCLAWLPSSRPTAAIKMSMVPHLPRPPPRPQGRQGIHRCFVFPGPIDVSFREPVRCGLQKAVCSREARIKPAARRDPRRPSISRGLQIRRQKRKGIVCSFANVDGFIHPPPPPLLPPFSSPLFPLRSPLSATAERPCHLFCTEAWG